ncbi:MAG: AAA family ATPase [Deltaproteobacteria bacterium]|jgi:class 3 adenylate cyclase/tetratricopeptide (TPR) repeat protein|nr:AAA family ATPase [Deltaproteobacteria bacterium]
MKCSKCQIEVPEGMKFCVECGYRVGLICPECGFENSPDFKFCGNCGFGLTGIPKSADIDYSQPHSYTPKFLADKILTTRSSVQGERKLVTVFFADVAGFTNISEKLDPEDVHKIMDGAFKILMDEIHRYEGTINQFTGDGVMALFGAPLAHEDHVQRACHAALSVQKISAAYGEKVKHDHNVDFKMRIGLNSGPVVVGSIGNDLRMDYTAIGDTVNLASRMEGTADAGNIRVTAHTYRLAQYFFKFKPLGKIQIKGKEAFQEAYQLLETGEAATRLEASVARGLTKLVGRRREMEILISAIKNVKQGHAQIVDVVGEAGVGKSRLVYEFREKIGNEAVFLTGICTHHGRNINFLPVIDLIRQSFGIKEGMAEKEVREQIQNKAGEKLASLVPFYLNLLSLKVDDSLFNSLNPEGRKNGTFEAVKELLLAQSQETPLVVFIEDIHWIDKVSEELLTFVSHCIKEHPILFLTAYRPEADPGWAQGSYYQRLGIETLSHGSSIHLVHNILGGLSLDQELAEKIAEKTEGNTFFIEEIVRELVEQKEIIKSGEAYVCSKSIHDLVIPNTIQGLLASRMDRLSDDLKQTMQVASVIGRDFAFTLLKSIMELGDDLRSHLTNLIGLEILYEKTLYPDLEYIFKHAFTQEVAYESLLKQRRREIHGRVARAIEDIYVENLGQHYELLAYHWEQSDYPKQAFKYLLLAGEKSNANQAILSARSFYEKALNVSVKESFSLDPETEVQLYRGLATASVLVGDVEKAIEENKTAVLVCRKHEFVGHEIEILVYLAMNYWQSGKKYEECILFFDTAIERALELKSKVLESQVLALKGTYVSAFGGLYQGSQTIEKAVEIAEATGDQRSIMITRIFKGNSERWLGKPREAIESTEGFIEMLKSVSMNEMLLAVVFFRGIAFAEMGKFEEGMTMLEEGIDICEKYGNILLLGRLLNSLGYCHGELYQTEHALELNLKSYEVSRKLMEMYPMGRQFAGEVVAQANVNLMENLIDQGKTEAALKRLNSFEAESNSPDYQRARYRWKTRMKILEAQILIDQGDIDKAENIINSNLKLVQEQHMMKFEGRYLRLLGEAQVVQNENDAAFSNFNNAIELLKEVGNPRQLWLAHLSLANFHQKSGRADLAREQFMAANAVVQSTADGLKDKSLRQSFIETPQVQEIINSTKL